MDGTFLLWVASAFLCSFLEGCLPAVLREVQLDLVEPAKCKYVLQSVKPWHGNQRVRRPQPAMTVLCAGPESGGRDACQVEGQLPCLTHL